MASSPDSPIKNQIRRLVRGYIKSHPEDYATVVKAITIKRNATHDEFAQLEGSHMRALYEIPEQLMEALVLGLDDEGSMWMRTTEGGRWFAKEFRQFSIASSI